MTEIYWLRVIGCLNTISCIVKTLGIIALVALILLYCTFEVSDDDDRRKQAAVVRWLHRSVVISIISAVCLVFIPNQKELIVIYGIGGTIDYIKSNGKAKELPDKVVDALTRYFDSLESGKEKDE